MTEPPARRFPFGGGSVELAADGSVVAVGHPTRGHSMLLREDASAIEAAFHGPERRWGKGFVLAGGRGHRFDRPDGLRWHPDGVDLTYGLGPLTLTVTRRVGAAWTESYSVRNSSDYPVSIGSWGISTPWRDLYGSSRDSLRGAVHAHVWTGGADAWVWAVPMDGSGPGLGLTLDYGELWAYSVESRHEDTSSNVRGHLYLHVTDTARAPHTLGGQPQPVLPPGGSYRLGWRLNWYDSLADFHRQRTPMITADRFAAPAGEAVTVLLAAEVLSTTPLALTDVRSGVQYVTGVRGERRSRIAVYHHPPLRELAERRAVFLLDRQRPSEREGSRRFAFVPYDNHSGLTVLEGGWSDWSDGRERVGSALLLQQLRQRGWGEQAALGEALAGYHRFVVENLVQPDGTVLDDARGRRPPRLYNFPWFARFLLDEGDLDRAAAVISRYYDLGGGRFLAFELGSVVGDVAAALRAAGRAEQADSLIGSLLHQARTFLDYGDDLPAHEVNYEQSIVAPLLDLLLAAHRIDPALVPAPELRRRLAWLRAFGADQPDVRLHHIPIRHWDGYWFGGLRQWGDVFPHYWSVLSAAAFLSWPDGLLPAPETAQLRDEGRAILRGNLVSFAPDGSATCAFVYPSCVNGQPAHAADPLANDQDWALVYALRLLDGAPRPDPTTPHQHQDEAHPRKERDARERDARGRDAGGPRPGRAT